MTVEFHPAALREVEDAQAWYEERSLVAAAAFLRELSAAIRRLLDAPARYPPAEPARVEFSSAGFRSPSTTGSSRTH